MSEISSQYLLTLTQQLEHIGVSSNIIKQSLGMDVTAIKKYADDRQVVPVEIYGRLYQLYLQQMNAENFAFPNQIGETMGRYQMLLALMVNSDTLQSALRKLHDFYQTFSTAKQLVHYHHSETGSIHCELTMLMQGQYRNTEQQTTIAANLAVAFHRILCWLTDTQLPLLSVDLEGPNPTDNSNYLSLFNCPVNFSCATTQLVYSGKLLTYGIVQTEQSLQQFLLDFPAPLFTLPNHSEQLLGSKIQSLILHNLQHHLLTLDEISNMLNMKPAQVKIRLKHAGTSFHKLVESVRRKRAIELLSQSTLELSQIADLLGFPATSAFHRSFKRWTGKTPGALRKEYSEQSNQKPRPPSSL